MLNETWVGTSDKQSIDRKGNERGYTIGKKGLDVKIMETKTIGQQLNWKAKSTQ